MLSPADFILLADRFSEAALLLTGDGIVLEVNRQFRRLQLADSSPKGKHLADLSTSALSHVQAYVDDCARNREPVMGALEFQTLRGETTTLRCDGSLLQHGQTRAASQLLIKLVPREQSTTQFGVLNQKVADLNEEMRRRQQLQSALIGSEERLRLALDAGRMGSWQWNITTGLVEWSATLEKIHGLAEGSFGGSFEAYQQDIHPEDRERILASIQETVHSGQDHHLEYRIVWPDGSLHWLESRGRLFRDDAGKPVRMVGFCMDITERKRTEQTLLFLAESSKSLSSLVDYKSTLQKIASLSVPHFADWCAVDMLEGDGSVQRLAVAHVDPAMVGLAEELHRRYPPHPDAEHGVMKVLRTGQAEFVPEIPTELLEGAAHDAEHLAMLQQMCLTSYICVPLRVNDSVLGCVTFVGADSGRRYTHADLSLAADLAHRAAVAIQNALLYQQVREADRRKDEFLAMLAHELRNPLAPIRSGLDLLAIESSGHREIVELMQSQVEHVVRLVDDLLDVSRIMRGKVELRREIVNLAELIQRSVVAVRPSVDSRQQQLAVQVEGGLILDADPVRIVQVIENLLTNASKYMDAKGKITLSVERSSDTAVITVQDTGVGIDKELLPHVFELFTQSSRSIDRAQGGLGIGLTLVQRLWKCMVVRCPHTAMGSAMEVLSLCDCRSSMRFANSQLRLGTMQRCPPVECLWLTTIYPLCGCSRRCWSRLAATRSKQLQTASRCWRIYIPSGRKLYF